MMNRRSDLVVFVDDPEEVDLLEKGESHERIPTICVDFDGTIADYSAGFQGEGIYGSPLPGAKEALDQLKEEGWEIIIFTCRNEVDKIARYLDEHGIPYDYINKQNTTTGSPKPHADVYIDDRAVAFDGDWHAAYHTVREFRPWQQRESEKVSVEVHVEVLDPLLRIAAEDNFNPSNIDQDELEEDDDQRDKKEPVPKDRKSTTTNMLVKDKAQLIQDRPDNFTYPKEDAYVHRPRTLKGQKEDDELESLYRKIKFFTLDAAEREEAMKRYIELREKDGRQ